MKTLFNDGWQFTKIHLESAEAPIPDEAELLSLPDEKFAPVNIPHDWLIWNTEDLYENSIGMYRKTFRSEADGKRTIFRFEGVYMDTSVYINGVKTTEWKYGYTTFETDVTALLKKGENTITVISVYRSPNTRWYSGAGIFRDVWRIEVPEAHLVSDGVYFTANKNDDGSWTAKIKAEACLRPIVSHGEKLSGNSDTDCPFEAGVSAGSQKCEQAVVSFALADDTGNIVAEKAVPVTLNPVVTDNPYWYLDPKGAATAEAEFQLHDIRVWDIDDPYLYTLTTTLHKTADNALTSTADKAPAVKAFVAGDASSAPQTSSADKAPRADLLDSTSQKVGFRTTALNSDKGFFLNDRHVKLHGVCQHHDLGALGSAFNKTALTRQFQIMKDMGVNAIRTSHNPPAPAFLDLADEMGLLIIDECFDMWEKPKTTHDYGNFFNDWHDRDVASWIRRDRNHACIIMWSIGNEIYDTHQGNGLAITKDLCMHVREHDPRKNVPITIGSNYMEFEGAQSCAELIDAAGYNYLERLYDGHHKAHPSWCIYGSETSATVQSRGVYHFPASFRVLTHDDQQCSSLGNCSSNWGAINTTAAITKDRDAPYCLGQFLWTGWDYIGEPTPYFTKNSYFGQVDTAGFKKDTYFLYQAEWTDYRTKPMVHLLPYWDFNEGQLIDIRAYTNAPYVELLFNGKSLGVQHIDHAAGQTLSGEWQLAYKPGTITAIARDDDGKELARESHTTPGDPARIVLSANKNAFDKRPMAKDSDGLRTVGSMLHGNTAAGGSDLIFVEIHTVDKDGNPVPNARNRITVSVEGARLEGLDNGDSTDYEQYKTTSRKLFNNALIAIISPLPAQDESAAQDAPVTVTVSSPGLNDAVLHLNGNACAENTDSTAGAARRTGMHVAKAECAACSASESEVPVRKIELTIVDTAAATTGDGSATTASAAATASDRICPVRLGPEKREVTLKAHILPENATLRDIEWAACCLEGIKSKAVKIDAALPDENGDVKAVVTAVQDGEFRLRCSARNGKVSPEIISELEFSVTGLGTRSLNPYEFISACSHTDALHEPKLSFQGGVYTLAERNWLGFDSVEFGEDGSDEFTIPIFSFDTTVPLELWDGNPDKGGSLIMKFEYNSPSWYNHYQANTWKLPRRLYGCHDLYILSTTRFSIQGFVFTKSSKAFSLLSALNAERITGDAFRYEADGIYGIGNNVTLEFGLMDFGTKSATHIMLNGRAVNGTNSVHLIVTPENPEDEVIQLVVEVPETQDMTEHTFALNKAITGRQKVSFLFLPGSQFDLQSFQFK